MATQRAPKQWVLTKTETITTFDSWRHNLTYVLSLDPHFAPFLIDGVTWQKKTATTPLRGLTDDGDDTPEATRRTAQMKLTHLELMLGQVANFCPIISRSSIVKNSVSMNDIWQKIRQHFGFASTGAHFLDLGLITLEPNERPEDLFQRLTAFFEDNLLTVGCGVSHHGDPIEVDEDLTPTIENTIVFMWLHLVHPSLPQLVKQRYGAELRNKSLASIKNEISQALDTLLDEIRCTEDTRTMRINASQGQKPKPRRQRKTPSCILCVTARRSPSDHYLSTCHFLPPDDRRAFLRARCTDIEDDDFNEQENSDDYEISDDSAIPVTHRVEVVPSPYLDVFFKRNPVRLTFDCGATGNMISLDCATSLGAKIQRNTQSAFQADGKSALNVVGETRLVFKRDNHTFVFEGLVIKSLDVDVLAATPFMTHNDIAVRPARKTITLADGTTYVYDDHKSARTTARLTHVLRAPSHATTLWPGDSLELDVPSDLTDQACEIAIEPRTNTIKCFRTTCTLNLWPSPAIITPKNGKIRVVNDTDEPQFLRKEEQFCQVHAVFTPKESEAISPSQEVLPHSKPDLDPHRFVVVDPDNTLSPGDRDKFHALHSEYASVFDPSYPGYNGSAGPFEAVVNMGPVQPPQRKGRLPQYSNGKLHELQQKFNELESLGVFARPEDIGITVEYLNPSFLVKKPQGGFRLVTAFSDVGRYAKPQPSLMPDVDSVLRKIAQWKFLVKTDLTSAFYQIPLSKDSMKYCGVCTPFQGVRVYTRCAMGMPGSETALEELTCRVLGNLLEEGIVTKLADDLYCGGQTPAELLANWRKVLKALSLANLRLSSTKTVIAPRRTMILGWIWETGTLQASQHRISALSTCAKPTTVRQMRSFIGSIKAMARVIPHCSSYISPLDSAISGCDSKDRIVWTDELHAAFRSAQSSLSNNQTITLPRLDDQLWIVTDASAKHPGIAGTLYLSRHDKPRVCGFFSSKLKERQVTWLPCEVEALAIAASVKHFSSYLVQSSKPAIVLTDSKPCVQAFEKLCRGEFSVSPRVSTFLSTVSRYQAIVRHVSGAANIVSDFASRNSTECTDSSCQICSFIGTLEDCTVLRSTTNDIISGTHKLPFTTRSTWLSLQAECPDLRRVHSHLTQGTRPSKKITNARDVKRYLNVASVSSDGLLVVRRDRPLVKRQDCIVVPRNVLDGLLTALHLRLDHPSSHQLKLVTHRYFYALDLDSAIDRCTSMCHQCNSIRSFPKTAIEQTSSDAPAVIGVSFAADVMKRDRQLILVLRECVSSFTVARVINSERHEELRDALLQMCLDLRSLDGPHAVIRTDPAPGFQALQSDQLLQHHRITIEVGRIKNINHNPVAERAIQELSGEFLRDHLGSGTITPLQLSISVARLNSRIRSFGLSAREMLYQRDQFTNTQIPVQDMLIIDSQHQRRLSNHGFSEKSKAHSASSAAPCDVDIGDLVYLYSDRNKLRARPRYLVVRTDGSWLNISKFSGDQLRNASYRVKRTECFKVPSEITCLTPIAPLPETVDDINDTDDTLPSASTEPPISPSVDTPLVTPISAFDPVISSDQRVDCDSVLPPHDQVIQPDVPEVHAVDQPVRRSTRTRRLPSKFDDFVLQ